VTTIPPYTRVFATEKVCCDVVFLQPVTTIPPYTRVFATEKVCCDVVFLQPVTTIPPYTRVFAAQRVCWPAPFLLPQPSSPPRCDCVLGRRHVTDGITASCWCVGGDGLTTDMRNDW
jgi:hypothetical protein